MIRSPHLLLTAVTFRTSAQLRAGTHAPYAFRCGKDEESAQHATVAMRIESYDAKWGYFTQAGPPTISRGGFPMKIFEGAWQIIPTELPNSR